MKTLRRYKNNTVLYSLISRVTLENMNNYEIPNTQIVKTSGNICVLNAGNTNLNENPFIALQFDFLGNSIRIDVDLVSRTDLKDVLKHIKLKKLDENQFLISGFLEIGTSKFLLVSKFDEKLPDNIEFLEDEIDETFVFPE